MGSVTKLVNEIDKLYREEPKTAKQISNQLIYAELEEQIRNANLQLLKEFTDGIRLLISHHKSKCQKAKQ